MLVYYNGVYVSCEADKVMDRKQAVQFISILAIRQRNQNDFARNK